MTRSPETVTPLQPSPSISDTPGTEPQTPTAIAAAVSARGVGKSYTTASKGTVRALGEVNLEIAPGEFVAIVGASGCGKSTLLRMIAGFEKTTEGVMAVGERPVTGPGRDRGVVFQDYGLFPWLSVRSNVAYGPRQQGLPKDQVTGLVDRFLSIVGLTQFADTYPHELSGGMQQRVAIARVLANNPAVLLMDEPFGALDALTRSAMQADLLNVVAEVKATVAFVTHSVEEAVFLADRVVVMSGGPSHGVPGHIQAVVPIKLPHRRDPTSVAFNDLKRTIADAVFQR